MRSIVLFAAMALLVWAAGHATEPPDRPQQTGESLGRQPSEGAPLPFPEQMVAGTVADAAGKPLGGIAIKLFADGRLVHVGHTTASGAYEMRLPLDLEKDETVVLWYVSSTEDLMPQSVVLKQSAASSQAHLFNRCTDEVKLRPQIAIDVKLMTESEMLASLKAKGCL